MIEERRLTEGPIGRSLIVLAIPIMATAFVEMAYNLMDTMWLGHFSTEAAAAAGTAGFFTWIGSALFLLSKIGVEVTVARSYGRKDLKSAKKYAINALRLTSLIALIYTFILITFRKKLIGFFNIREVEVVEMAIEYLTMAARRPIWAVSWSRISPTSTMSGSWRSAERSTRANDRSILSFTCTWLMPFRRYSTGSSTVMSFFSTEFSSDSALYKVVVLPLPVGPVTRIMP